MKLWHEETKETNILKGVPLLKVRIGEKGYFYFFLLILGGHFQGCRASLQKETLIRDLEGPECGCTVLLGISSYVFFWKNFTLSDNQVWQKWIKDDTSPILYLMKNKAPILEPAGNFCHIYTHTVFFHPLVYVISLQRVLCIGLVSLSVKLLIT